MITFNSKGLLIPNRAISCTLDELKFHFVDSISSNTRLNIFNNYVEYSNQLKDLLGVGELKQWINGSFATLILHPKDMDFVTFIAGDIADMYKEELKGFTSNNLLLSRGIDPYIIEVHEQENESYYRYQSDKAYWNEKFDRTRRGRNGKKNPKGFLEIIY